jgi:cold shock CspA family protein
MRGFIHRLIEDRGFGFIRDAAGVDYFFHATGLRDVRFEALREGQAVDFAITDDGGRPRAVDVQPSRL